MPHKVKMQYLQISNIVDISIKHQISRQLTYMLKGNAVYKYKTVNTSIKHQISGQSMSMLKGCMYTCLI